MFELNTKATTSIQLPLQVYSCPVTCSAQKLAGVMFVVYKARALISEHLLSSSGYIDEHSGLSPVRAYHQDIQPFGRISLPRVQ